MLLPTGFGKGGELANNKLNGVLVDRWYLRSEGVALFLGSMQDRPNSIPHYIPSLLFVIIVDSVYFICL